MDILSALAKAFSDAPTRPLDLSASCDGYCGHTWQQVTPDYSIIGGKPPKEGK